MAHKDFENIVKGRFQGFESAPPESVWSNISDFRDRRRKRLLYLWWLLPILAVAGGGIALYSVNASEDHTTNSQHTEKQVNYKGLNKQTIKHKKVTKKELNPDKTVSQHNVVLPSTQQTSTPLHNPEQEAPINDFTPNRKANIPLSKMVVRPIQFSATVIDGLSPWFDGIRRDNISSWTQSFGIQLGSFFTASRAKVYTAEPPNSVLSGQLNSEGSNNATYQRFLEIAPYYEWKRRYNGFGIRANLAFAATNISANTGNGTFLGNQKSYGLGIGSSYAFVRRRFQASAYLQFQGEALTTRYSIGDNYAWFGMDNEGGIQTITTDPNNTIPPSSYNQWVVSGEVGIRGEYALRNPLWRLQAGIGYRNYFWQQNVPIESNEAVIVLPQLIHFNLGVSYRFRY